MLPPPPPSPPDVGLDDTPAANTSVAPSVGPACTPCVSSVPVSGSAETPDVSGSKPGVTLPELLVGSSCGGEMTSPPGAAMTFSERQLQELGSLVRPPDLLGCHLSCRVLGKLVLP